MAADKVAEEIEATLDDTTGQSRRTERQPAASGPIPKGAPA
jgi:hypothetical protein